MWGNCVVAVASIFAGFGVAHLVDDFLYGVPAEFNLTVVASQVMGWAFFAALTGLIAMASRGSRRSYAGLMIVGTLLALADTLKHVPEMIRVEVYRSGLSSQGFAIGLIASGLGTAVVSYGAWRSSREP